MGKKGVSPIIATVLLISIALVLALIIFLWARSFTSEQLQKFDEPVENACENVHFEAEADASGVYVVNRGNVPLSGVAIQEKGLGSVSSVTRFDHTISSGQTAEEGIELGSGEFVLIPIILGETESYKKEHKCSDEYGIVIEVI